METISAPTLIPGRHGPASREVIEAQRASQLRAIQELRRRIGAPAPRNVAAVAQPLASHR